MSDILPGPNTATTLSLFSNPGQNSFLFNTNSNSIFTFGDFEVFANTTNFASTGTTPLLTFTPFSTLNTLSSATFTPPQSYSVNPNELNLPETDPQSYSYFGSFYTEVANAINNVLITFPFAILSYDNGTGTTVYDYTQTYNNITGQKSAYLRIPMSALTNQGGIILNSGSSIVGTVSLVNGYTGYSLQMSAQTVTATTTVANITSYTFSSDTYGNYLGFTIDNFLDYFTSTVSGSTKLPIYIRPSEQNIGQYNLNLSKLESNLLFVGQFDVPSADIAYSSTTLTFTWPRTIDGFSPDSFGPALNNYKNSILASATTIDTEKTNILVQTVVPENFLEMDSQNQIFATLTQAYAHEFDQIKHYIDGIAYAHSITYSGEESTPQKFMYKLGTLLGWKLSDSFSEVDLFAYLAGDVDGQGNSYSFYNLELWKRILININWLYKKKGTRDAIQFLFNLLGAPPALARFDEFTYQISQVLSAVTFSASTDIKINPNGYINYNASQFIFQAGGVGRGTGQEYINQWTPEFAPLKQVDNIKVVTGDSSVFGSENIINSKEIFLALDPANAIEYNLFQWYQMSGTSWDWSSLFPPFSSNTVPFEFAVDPWVVSPPGITGMTFSQYLDNLYMNSVDPRTRKTIGVPGHSSFYPWLRAAYLNYYLWSDPTSNQLTFFKLQAFLDLIEVNFQDYTLQLLPATTIFDVQGTIIRNTEFNRQKFVYPEGIDKSSEFQILLPPSFLSDITPTTVTSIINGYQKVNITPATINIIYDPAIKVSINGETVDMKIISTLESIVGGHSVSATIISGTTSP